jgi:hypothetical protein
MCVDEHWMKRGGHEKAMVDLEFVIRIMIQFVNKVVMGALQIMCTLIHSCCEYWIK